MPYPEDVGTGGGGFTLGPEQNVFTGANRSAAETSRDNYFTSNPSNLAAYNANTALNIRLEYDDGGDAVAQFQVRNGAGDAWLDNDSAIGVRGGDGTVSIPGVADGTIPMVVGGALVASSMVESDDEVRSGKSLQLPGGSLDIEQFRLSYQGGQGLLGTSLLENRSFDFASREFTEASGSLDLFVENREASTTFAFQSRTDERINDSQLIVNVRNAVTATIFQWTSAVDAQASGDFYIEIFRGTSITPGMEPEYVSHTSAQIASGDVFTLNGGNVDHDTRVIPTDSADLPRRSHPLQFVAGADYVVRFTAVGANFNVLGTTTTQEDIDDPQGIFTVVGQQVPSYAVTFQPLTQERVLTVADLRSDEQVQDISAAMLTGGTHQGITVRYDDDTGTIDLDVTGVNPPIAPTASVSSLVVDIPGTVATGFNFNTSHTITFNTSDTGNISTLNLVITGGDDQALTVPTMDGTHTQALTFAGFSSGSAQVVTFQIRGTTNTGAAIMSNTYTVNVRDVQDHEQAYFGVRPTDDFATVNVATLTGVDVQAPGSTYDVSVSLPATQVLGILEPTDRVITSILEQTFGVESLDRFTRTAAVRTIGGQSYDLLTLTNNGPTGNIDFRVTHG